MDRQCRQAVLLDQGENFPACRFRSARLSVAFDRQDETELPPKGAPIVNHPIGPETMNTKFSFSARVWNLKTGADPFGPEVRADRPFNEKARILKSLGFDYVQLHDDDAVPMDTPANLIEFYTRKLKTQ